MIAKAFAIFPPLAVLHVFTGCSTINPDISVESSDGRWADNEVTFKGRDFESLLWLFESYKLRFGSEETMLYRTTKKPPFAYGIKWRIPYRDTAPHIDGRYYIDPSIKREVGRSRTPEETAKIEANFEATLRSLR